MRQDALAAAAPLIDALGGAEDLAAHVEAVRMRVPGKAGPEQMAGVTTARSG